MVLTGNGNNNQEFLLPAVTSLDTNSSYQLQIPVNTFDVGQYFIKISPLSSNVSIGNFSLKINPVLNNTTIPIENFISLGSVSLAVILTIIAYYTRKKN